MKKFVLVFLLTASIMNFAVAQSSSEKIEDSTLQVLVPRDVFIGDSGQIQYSFRSPVDFSGFNENSQSINETIEIDLKAEDFLEDTSCCLVSKTTLSRNGINYNLCITFIPWKTGIIKFHGFNLERICNPGKENEAKISSDFDVKLEPVAILSLAEKLGATTLRPPKSPALLPNTKYYLWVFIVLAIFLFFALCAAIIRLPEIIRRYRQLKVKFGFYRNALKTKRQLNMLLRKKIGDSEFAEQWQKIVRSYLEYRFKSSFASVTGKNIEKKIYSVTMGMMNQNQEKGVEDLTALFVRTNYIRFASGSIDSQMLPREEHQASFIDGERKTTVSRMHKVIDTFEKEEVND